MAASPRIRAFVDRGPSRPFLEGMFRDVVEQGELEVEECWDPSGMISSAEMSLFRHPEVLVALVIETGDADEREVAQDLAATRRLLVRARDTGWHVAVVRPRLDAWAVADPRIRAAFDEAQPDEGYHERAELFSKLTAPGQPPFDRAALRRTSREFDRLCAAIDEHLEAVYAQG